MNALATSYLFWIALIIGLLIVYVLPTVIAAIRGVEGLGWIIFINLLPTGVGWLAALIAALTLPARQGPDIRVHDRMDKYLPRDRPGARPDAEGVCAGHH